MPIVFLDACNVRCSYHCVIRFTIFITINNITNELDKLRQLYFSSHDP